MNQGIYIIAIIFLILYEHQNQTIYEYFTSNVIVSSIDQRAYQVVGGFTDVNNASNTMAQLNDFIIEFLRFLKNKFIINRNGSQLEQEFVKRVLKNYNPDVIFENDPLPGGDTSFVVNKGEKFGICLRSKKTQKIHDTNLLKFVMIHEMSHLGCIKYGHDYQFWSWMKFMLIQATESKLYTPVNYEIRPTTYCGIEVTFSPFFSNKYDWRNPRAN